MDLRIVLTAVPGAGKSTIIEKIRQLRADIKTVNFGDIMFEAAKEEYEITSRDLMRSNLSREDYRLVQTTASKKIAEMEGNIIVDTHCSILTPIGYFPGLPEEVVKRLRPDVIVLLEYDPNDIAARRNRDMESSERTGREVEIAERIELQQQMNRGFATAYATLARSSVKIISLKEKEEYEFQHADMASKEIVDMFR